MFSDKSTNFLKYAVCLFFTLFLILQNGLNAAAASPEPANPGKRWLIAVGICKFADTRIPNLTYCVADAETIADYFKDDRVDPEQIILLTNEAASRKAVTDALRLVSEKIAPEDSLFFFYSSHGAGDDSGTTYFITFDTVFDELATTALPMQELKKEVENINCRNIVMMIDTCHSGGVKSLGRQDEKALNKLVRSANKQTRIAILTSSRTNESSIESKKWQHGAFTYFMLDGLAGTADNFPRDGHVSVTELFDYVMVAVPRATDRAQHPSAKFSYNWPAKKDAAVKIGNTRNKPPRSSDPASTGVVNNAGNTGSESIIDSETWRSPAKSGNSGKPRTKPGKPWQNIVE